MINFNNFESFIDKCKSLQEYGYDFPSTLSEIPTYNDIDYDSYGQLFTNIKSYNVYLIIDANENTHILMGKYYKHTEAVSIIEKLTHELSYDSTQYLIRESTTPIYEAKLDSLILLEEESMQEQLEDFSITKSSIGDVYEFKIINSLMDESEGSILYEEVENFEWVLIQYINTETTISSFNGTSFTHRIETNSVILETVVGAVYKVIVHRKTDTNQSVIKYETIVT